MKLVTLLATVDEAKCNGCRICPKVCPTLAITMVARKAVVDEDRCVACGNCGQRCPELAITFTKLASPKKLEVTIDDLPRQTLDDLCIKAGFHPSQIVCYCTATRAEEVAAAILKGAETPEEISLRTGLRSGCTVECIQPALRLLEAAGLHPVPPKNGWQWYGRTPTLSEIPPEVRAKYSNHGFCFEEDEKLFATVVASDRR
ncbi:MAG: 4Fe-4S binding protein [Phyllobacteriaceae bacterium]|nr:4Fe-4S binding protein [Phyllobacteriaceae bacterium]